jgi:hypothetical protein
MFGLAGIFLLGLAARISRIGYLELEDTTVRRDLHPIQFWLSVVFLGLAGIGMCLIAFLRDC